MNHPDVAADDNRCDYQPGLYRCIRQPHPRHPDAHVRDILTYERESVEVME